ncbi:MAG: GNAT family N-acetyltransferase [Terriglobales bacterium]
MPYQFRDSLAADFRELWRIDQQCFAPGIAYSQRELAWYMAMRGAFTIVAEQESSDTVGKSEDDSRSIVGFLVGQKHARGMGHVVTIDVLPQARRSGVGSQLMNECERRLSSMGCKSVYLEMAVDNAPALRFYKRHGYSILKTIPRYYNGELDAFLLGKDLT